MAWKHPKNPCRTDAPLEIQACSVPINPQTSGGEWKLPHQESKRLEPNVVLTSNQVANLSFPLSSGLSKNND